MTNWYHGGLGSILTYALCALPPCHKQMQLVQHIVMAIQEVPVPCTCSHAATLMTSAMPSHLQSPSLARVPSMQPLNTSTSVMGPCTQCSCSAMHILGLRPIAGSRSVYWATLFSGCWATQTTAEPSASHAKKNMLLLRTSHPTLPSAVRASRQTGCMPLLSAPLAAQTSPMGTPQPLDQCWVGQRSGS